jgi:hypothetical protein
VDAFVICAASGNDAAPTRETSAAPMTAAADELMN